MATPEESVLDAAEVCCQRWGVAKVTIDDIARESGISRASIYRLFPGGKDVMFDRLRARSIDHFFADLRRAVREVESFDERVVNTVVVATIRLRADRQLAAMMSTAPGETLDQLSVDGLPQIIETATTYLGPLLRPFLPDDRAIALVDVLSRLTISYFLAPSEVVNLGDEASAREFLHPIIRALTPVGA